MKIHGADGMSREQLQLAVQEGGRLVLFTFCISIIIMSFKRSSGIHFVPAGQSVALKAGGFSLISLLLGWWGIPWGPIWTVSTVFGNLRGGQDVTADVLNSWQSQGAIQQAPSRA